MKITITFYEYIPQPSLTKSDDCTFLPSPILQNIPPSDSRNTITPVFYVHFITEFAVNLPQNHCSQSKTSVSGTFYGNFQRFAGENNHLTAPYHNK